MFGGDEWLIIVIVALVVFGSAKLPSLAKNLGEAQREFKRSMREGAEDDEDDPPPVATASKVVETVVVPKAIEAPETPDVAVDATVAAAPSAEAATSEVTPPSVG